MMRSILILLMLLLLTISSSSQTIYPKLNQDSLIVITPLQLKQTNLIFLEHEKLTLQLKEFKIQVDNYSNLLNHYKETERLLNDKITLLIKEYNENKQTINKLNATITKKDKKLKRRKVVAVIGVTVGVLGILLGGAI